MERCLGKEKNWFTNLPSLITPQVHKGPHWIESIRLKAIAILNQNEKLKGRSYQMG
jgi:hypothetical protein